MKVQFQVKDGKTTLSILDNGTPVASVDISGNTRDGTPRVERLVEKLQKAADKASEGSEYRYALKV
jgi:hypothetical protein